MAEKGAVNFVKEAFKSEAAQKNKLRNIISVFMYVSLKRNGESICSQVYEQRNGRHPQAKVPRPLEGILAAEMR